MAWIVFARAVKVGETAVRALLARAQPLEFRPPTALLGAWRGPGGRYGPVPADTTPPVDAPPSAGRPAQTAAPGPLPQLPRQPHDRRCDAPVDGPSELVELFPGPICLLQRPISCPYGPQNRPGQAVRPSAAPGGRVEGLKGLKSKPQGLFGVSDSFRVASDLQAHATRWASWTPGPGGRPPLPDQRAGAGGHVRDDDLGGTWKDNGPPKSPAGGLASEGSPSAGTGWSGDVHQQYCILNIHANIIIP